MTITLCNEIPENAWVLPHKLFMCATDDHGICSIDISSINVMSYNKEILSLRTYKNVTY